MHPWSWFWAPQFHFPFSGDLAQRIQPETDWFFGAISPRAGQPRLEQKIHQDVASYGRQLGLLTEAVLALAEPDSVTAEQGQAALDRLKTIQREVEELKSRERAGQAEGTLQALRQLARDDPAALQQVLRQFAATAPRLPASS
jgi:hypothetical protein